MRFVSPTDKEQNIASYARLCPCTEAADCAKGGACDGSANSSVHDETEQIVQAQQTPNYTQQICKDHATTKRSSYAYCREGLP
jgi:hypothetical protein